VKLIRSEREKLFRQMKAMKDITPYPTVANFILFRTQNAVAVFRRLLKQGVLVRNVSDQGRLQNCLRVTVGSPTENRAFLKALQKSI